MFSINELLARKKELDQNLDINKDIIKKRINFKIWNWMINLKILRKRLHIKKKSR